MNSLLLSRPTWFLIGVLFVCAAADCLARGKIKEIEYDDVLGGPPFSARQEQARPVYSHEDAQSRGADKIGSFKIRASSADEAREIASEEAAKLGADYFWMDTRSWYQHTKKKFVRDNVTSTEIGDQTIVTETYHYEDIPVKGTQVYRCYMYRLAPTSAGQAALQSSAIFGCLISCTTAAFQTVCRDSTLEAYLLGDFRLQGYEINSFFECLVERPEPHRRYPHHIEDDDWHERMFAVDYRKFALLLDRGLIGRTDYYDALQMVRAARYDASRDFVVEYKTPPRRADSLDRSLARIYAESYVDAKKRHAEFLKRVEDTLVEYGPPEPTNTVEGINASVTSVLFYESGYEPREKEEREYATAFDSSDTHYVFWEINLECPRVESKKEISFESVIRRSDGSIVGSTIRDFLVFPGATDFWLTTGWGAQDAGKWSPGDYWVELYVDRIFVAVGEFTVD